ncbi:sensor histidine kinase [Lysinibacillus piscis]|uniref:histidine kinase n=1 Tax=Lysinibacillus piscis TaxID=2518931 RepID=A0ABQ5NPF0_9BACI|nr:cell wall metabolism sensor histidine kinase WalK [Lysinibacillus sp. KH24]GLC90235.1 two-component sensor histidine kinase [Lysinibacillus sp. KH24]
MRKLSVKLGIIFFITLFCIETFMMLFLHTSLANSRVAEELASLQARGNAHRMIAEQNFDAPTLAHIVLMESVSDTDVMIIDNSGTILASSNLDVDVTAYIKQQKKTIPYEGQVLESNWKEKAYIATISPVHKAQQVIGYMIMFQDTASIHTLMARLNKHFLIVGIVSGIVTMIVIVLLSKKLARPLIDMKEATLKIGNGDFTVALSRQGRDELSDLANAIQFLSDDLQHLKQERGEFLSSIAHELRTPLTFIKGYTDILAKRELATEERQKYLGIIVEETDRLSHLIKDLFDLAKMDENSFVIHKEPIDLSTFFTTIAAKLSPAFHEKQIDFIVDCEAGVTWQMDPARLEQMMLNLLNNALIYCSHGDKTLVSVQRERNALKIIVSDTGKGIPQKDLPYIFERFYRVEKSRTRALGGSGLGLAIVKELVYAHGGEIRVDSEVNKGTTFELLFKGATDEDIIVN